MDKSKLIENIKNQLKSLMSSEVKFAEIKAGDLMINCPDEECVVGSEVFTIDADGNNVPLADGDYTLDSGETITVLGGKVEAIASSEPEMVEAGIEIEIEPKEEGEESESEGEESEDEDEMGKKEKMMAMLEERLAKCEKMLEEMSKSNNKMAQELSKVSSEPSTTSITVEPTEFKSVEEKKEGVGAVDIMAIREKARKNR